MHLLKFFMFILTLCLFSFSSHGESTQSAGHSLFLTLDANYSLRTENSRGKMVRTKPGTVSPGQLIRIDGLSDKDFVYNDDGSINSFETLTNIQNRKHIPARPYGRAGRKEIFFPVTVYDSSGEEIKLDKTPEIALLHAADKGVVNPVSEGDLNSAIEPIVAEDIEEDEVVVKRPELKPEDNSIFLTLDASYSIRTENPQGRMVRMHPNALTDGQILRLDGVAGDDVAFNSNGTINETLTLQNIQARQDIAPRPYGRAGRKEIFFPVTIFDPTGEEVKLDSTPEIALLHAAGKGVVSPLTDSPLIPTMMPKAAPLSEERVAEIVKTAPQPRLKPEPIAEVKPIAATQTEVSNSLFLTLDRNYSIRTENSRGKMVRLGPGSLSNGQVVRIDGVHSDDLSYNSDGSINEFETLTNYQARKQISPRPYGKGGSTEIFFPVSIYDTSGAEIKLDAVPEIALLHAAGKGVVNSVPESELKTRFLMSVSSRNRIHYVDYSSVSEGKNDCKNDFLSFDLPQYFLDYSVLPTTQCLEDTKSNGAHCLYPSGATFRRYARSGRRGLNKCYGMVNRQSCNSDFWKGMNLKQRINHTIEKADPVLKEFDINPFVAPCLTSKETTFESSTIRTKVACTMKRNTPTALGAFQINFPTLKDMVQRGLFNMSPSDRNKTPQKVINKLKPFLAENLTPESYALLTDPGMSVHSRSKRNAVDKLAKELYNLMTISFDLQLAMFGTVLKAKNYSFGAYYGAADSKSANAKYARYVGRCLDCMHERTANKNHDIHACVALSKGKSLAQMDRGFEAMAANVDNFQDKYCKDNFTCENRTCMR